MTPRIFSGIQPSGGLTIGNYLGALKRFVQKQEDGVETVFCIVDLHAITVRQDPTKLRHQTREAAAAFIAAGIDPKRSILFNQSQVSSHAELAWVLNCVARFGWMNRMTQFRDKMDAQGGENSENVSLGLFAYPALMAADILAYKATHVPVGDDQRQHLALARDIAAKFNHDFRADFFPLPQPLVEGAGARIMSLRDGTKKMSKSDPLDMSRINLTDDADTIAKKIKKATSDTAPIPDSVEALSVRPEVRNLVNIYAALSETTPEAVLQQYAGAGFGIFKPALADLTVAVLAPISTKIRDLMTAPDEIDRILGEGADAADAISRPIVDEVYDIVGMIRSRRR